MAAEGGGIVRNSTLLLGAVLAAGCSPSADNAANRSANASANSAAAAAAKHPTYCFFKDGGTKGWSASLDRDGNVVVKGKAYREDPRYKPQFSDVETAGAKSTLWLTIGQNSGFASPDNWWDVTQTIPGSGGVQSVTVKCGKKVLAELTVKRAG
jgi:hypothetical protein